jgi:predicted Fe-S protein YdhL (DUF1289 family)
MTYMSSISSGGVESGLDEQPVKSPCISICALDTEGVCSGCFRSGDEIRSWGAYTNAQRLTVLNIAHEREKKVNPFL